MTVTIFGRDYTIKSEVDPDHIKKAADHLNLKMKEVAESYPSISENRVAVLAALNIAYELSQTQGGERVPGDDEKRIVRLAQKLSEVL